MLEFEMNMEDFTIILNAFHYYKKVENEETLPSLRAKDKRFARQKCLNK